MAGRFTPAQIHHAIGLINVNSVALKFPMNAASKHFHNWAKFFQKLHLKSLYAYSSDPNTSVVLNKPVGGIFFSVFIGENACLCENFTTYLRHSLEILELQSWHWSVRWHDEFEREWICQPIWGRVDSNSRCISHTRTTPQYFPLVLKWFFLLKLFL